jgi:hypothetical protein
VGEEGLGQLVPDGRQLLAVAAPGGIYLSALPATASLTKLDEDGFGGVVDDRIEVLAGENLDGLGVPIGRGLLRHQVLLQDERIVGYCFAVRF